mgnify:CR=1 FL=1
MGIIKAIGQAIGGTLADQWLEVIEADDMSDKTVFTSGVLIRKGQNTKGTGNTVSNGSIIHVYDNQFMMLVDGGKVVDYTAEPGYYSVFLDTYQVKAEISATKRGAIHRYHLPRKFRTGFILDLDYSLQRQTNSDMGIEVISDTEICGHKKTTYWAFDQYINFYVKFSKPFSYTLVTDSITMDNGKRLPVCKVFITL